VWRQGKAENFSTYIGHTFVFRDGDSDDLLARKVVTDPQELLVSSLVYGQCEVGGADCDRSDTEVLQRTEQEVNIWRGRLSSNIGRLRQNERQPPSKPLFAPVGFKKMRVPEPAWSKIQAFYQANKQIKIKEPWQQDDTHVNFWESHTTMTYISEDVRQTIFNSLRPVLEEWSHTKLTPTSCYGIRLYYNNSWLRDHVDIGTTHIVSAIINVDQDIDRDWPLMILDHNGDRHQVTMAPVRPRHGCITGIARSTPSNRD
jgi:hypothetical protein